jgi:phytoene dehydrogenase-like protein
VRDSIVVGSGPNGLAAAITLARAGRSVLVVEARETVGGGMRTEELTLDGFRHDTCSAIHPLGVASPFLRSVPLADHGVEWVHPPAPLAHPLDDGTAVVLERGLAETADGLGPDGPAWQRLFAPLVEAADALVADALAGPRPPRHPVLMGRFGLKALRSATGLSRSAFDGDRARALFAGNAAHSMLPLDAAASASFGLVLAMLGHAVGWPMPRGGSQALADGLASYLRSLGGEIETGRAVESLDEAQSLGRLVLLDVGPRQLLALAGTRLDGRYRRALERYRLGPGVVKVDYALSGPMPWRAEACARAATLHLGGTLDELAAAEAAVARGGHPERPFVLVAQQSLFDATRAPEGHHTLWAYTHVPNGSTVDVTGRIEGQLERFAPGFRDLVLARSVLTPADLEARNANYVGGDINGGSAELRQLFTRPVARPVPYRTPLEGVYLCSASTPPGGGVHGMCGYHAARAALRRR